ncbi:GNAT family N-acetyltransferase [Acholeplasma vituli]|uniref:GNAT family N-acetyltransferase n=1 Tax=Paracholeplasma vituli TaxID=69473 RepID=A0ABT2PW18_9MOLU|nr:GNAT family N-acetyltransferase [Paracholeplasma vituli]MCU0105159.1 GNAT family N-acetyltransferase [Paracholeplasma vituli]
MHFEALIEALGLPDSIKDVLLSYERLYASNFLDEIEGLRDIKTAPTTHEKLKRTLEDPNGFKMLYIFIKAIQQNHQVYQDLEISDSIYIETYKALPRFINEYFKETGIYVFERDWWAYRQVAMTIFRIGELEYELTTEENVPIISIHIPSDSRLTMVRIETSLRLARLFFNSRFQDYQNALMVSHTWLLSPALKGLLKPSSNILNFQNYFEIDQVFETDNSFLHWVFHTKEQNPNLLEAKTTLQRQIQDHLLKGGLVGAAKGTIDSNTYKYLLVKPNASHEHEVMLIKTELQKEGAYNGTSDLDTYDDYQAWLNSLNNPKIDTVQTTQYLLVDKDHIIYGFVHIRHELDDELKETYGHVSVTIRPVFQNKGFAKLALTLALEKLKVLGQSVIMVSCEETLEASIRTIESCLGIYQRTTFDAYIEKPVRVYQIRI